MDELVNENETDKMVNTKIPTRALFPRITRQADINYTRPSKFIYLFIIFFTLRLSPSLRLLSCFPSPAEPLSSDRSLSLSLALALPFFSPPLFSFLLLCFRSPGHQTGSRPVISHAFLVPPLLSRTVYCLSLSQPGEFTESVCVLAFSPEHPSVSIATVTLPLWRKSSNPTLSPSIFPRSSVSVRSPWIE